MGSFEQTLKVDIILEMTTVSLKDRTNINFNGNFFKKNLGNEILTHMK
jgi:hypothetical protein